MTTIVPNLYTINGVISTDKTVLENLNSLCTASSCWLTYDSIEGKWAVVINRAGLVSQSSFDDSSIIGNIIVSDTGVRELYNSVSVEFPHKTLRDEKDYVDIKIADVERYPNEIDNTLFIQLDCINNPAQAQQLANIELKQSRLSKIIEFRTDFNRIGISAGDIIDVTNSIYGFVNKKFRVLSVEEQDDDGLFIIITAIEYDDSIFNSNNIILVPRTKSTGIIIQSQNTAIQASNDAANGASLSRLLLANGALRLLNRLFSRSQSPTDPANPTAPSAFEPADKDADTILASVKKPEICSITGPESVCEGATVQLTVSTCCSSCLFDIPALDYEYTITGVDQQDIDFPLTGTLSIVPGQSVQVNIPTLVNNDAGSKTITFTVGGISKNIQLNSLLPFTYSTTVNNGTITEGGTSTVTLTTTDLTDGTVVPYTITGSGVSRLSTPLTGTVTVNANTATLDIVTVDDGLFTGTQSVTVTFNQAQADPCGQLDKTASIQILDNDSPPPPSTACQYVSVPIVWCGSFEGGTGELQALSSSMSMRLPVARAGEPTVNLPLTVSVSKGNPSTITVLTTAEVAVVTGYPGITVDVISTFNPVTPNGLITGTLTSVKGII